MADIGYVIRGLKIFASKLDKRSVIDQNKFVPLFKGGACPM